MRPSSPNPPQPDPSGQTPLIGSGAGGRLNLLLSHTNWRDEHWADCLPRLLEPMGVHAWTVHSGRQATDLIKKVRVDIAVVDLSLPLDEQSDNAGQAATAAAEEAGVRLLELLTRLPSRPPTLVVKRRRTRREDTRELNHALRAGAFAVIERPVNLETLLQVMRRVLCRHYADRWPSPPAPPSSS
ncbi:MAG: hypothetical protein H6812_02585 [Phycisphaeraceae bacterium]|nr:hypothetical protein [Phycisphaerales bacterium]MCB9842125.1 hypothetical protein [Phycisphaeraceae bacterium]